MEALKEARDADSDEKILALRIYELMIGEWFVCTMLNFRYSHLWSTTIYIPMIIKNKECSTT
jgi:hypothetical protein